MIRTFRFENVYSVYASVISQKKTKKNKSVFLQKKRFFNVFCYTRMFSRYIITKCYVILLRIAIANIRG